MNIAVIGAGFTGLSASYQLAKNGHKVTIFEKDNFPGGLAVGFREKNWEWSLEKHYHHWFANDNNVLQLAKEINYEVIVKRPKTSTYVNECIYQLDSPSDILKFPPLTLFERLRMGTVLAFLKYNPFWKPLEKFNVSRVLPKLMGKKPYETVWEPLFRNKFGKYKDDISLAWFWARIVKRTPKLIYPKGGFLEFANALIEKIEQKGGRVQLNTEVKEIVIDGKTTKLKFQKIGNWKLEIGNYDKVVVTLPFSNFAKITPQLPDDYKNKLLKLKGLGSINIILRLKKQFLKDGTYWLSICDKNFPIMAIVEHTNFMDGKNYNNEHLVYLGKYLPANHPYMKISKEELLKIYDPFLRKINPNYQKSILDFEIFRESFAQPITPINYSKIIPPFETPLKNVYLANIQQVYPWDRGTNYAVELGEKIAKLTT